MKMPSPYNGRIVLGADISMSTPNKGLLLPETGIADQRAKKAIVVSSLDPDFPPDTTVYYDTKGESVIPVTIGDMTFILIHAKDLICGVVSYGE